MTGNKGTLVVDEASPILKKTCQELFSEKKTTDNIKQILYEE